MVSKVFIWFILKSEFWFSKDFIYFVFHVTCAKTPAILNHLLRILQEGRRGIRKTDNEWCQTTPVIYLRSVWPQEGIGRSIKIGQIITSISQFCLHQRIQHRTPSKMMYSHRQNWGQRVSNSLVVDSFVRNCRFAIKCPSSTLT